MEQVDEHRARRLWRALEPYHAVVYFAPEPQAACTELGTRGYWMSYFALRAAPLGAAPPELVAALFYGFAPRLVARAVPDTWRVAPPERFLAVRLDAVDAALHRLLGAETLRSAEVAEAAGLAREAALAAPTAGRAMGCGERRPALAGAPAPRALARPDGAARAARRRSRRRPADRGAGSRWSRWRCLPPTSRWTPPGCAPAAAGPRTSGRPGCDRLVERGLLSRDGALTDAGRACAPRWRRTPTRSRTHRARRSATPAPTRLTELVAPLVRDHRRGRLVHARQPDGPAAPLAGSPRPADRRPEPAVRHPREPRRARMEGVSRPDPRQAAQTAALCRAMAGAVDLAAVKARSEAAAPRAGGARAERRPRRPAAPGWVVDVTEETFQAEVLDRSLPGARRRSTCGPSGAARASSSRRCWSGSPRRAAAPGCWRRSTSTRTRASRRRSACSASRR